MIILIVVLGCLLYTFLGMVIYNILDRSEVDETFCLFGGLLWPLVGPVILVIGLLGILWDLSVKTVKFFEPKKPQAIPETNYREPSSTPVWKTTEEIKGTFTGEFGDRFDAIMDKQLEHIEKSMGIKK